MGKPSIIVVKSEYYKTLAEAFYTHQLTLGYHKKSCRTQWNRVNEFLHFSEIHFAANLQAITTSNIITYYKYQQNRPSRMNGSKLNLKTANDFIKAVDHFYSFLQHIREVSVNPVSVIKLLIPQKSTTRIALSQAEINKLYKHAETYQERAILTLGYGCGLRVSELVALNIADVKLREKLLIVKKGKNNKSRIVPLNKQLTIDLSDYLYHDRLVNTNQSAKANQSFIVHTKGERMRQWTYNKILKNLIERTNDAGIIIKQISIHHLRHSIATHLIEQGVPMEKVRDFLGHSELETTQIYTHISKAQLRIVLSDEC